MDEWRKAEDYAYTANLTSREWAWEFSRRSKTYRQLWQEMEDFSAAALATRPEGGTPLPPEYRERLRATGLDWPMNAPDVRIYDVSPIRWNIGWMQDSGYRTSPNDPKYRRVVFNLSQPLPPQLQAVRWLLEWEREIRGVVEVPVPRTRQRPALWRTWLRLLDARNAGEPIAEMGRVLFAGHSDDRKNAQGALRAAEAFSESGYKALLWQLDPNESMEVG